MEASAIAEVVAVLAALRSASLGFAAFFDVYLIR
jgi:hypothetical protein